MILDAKVQASSGGTIALALQFFIGLEDRCVASGWIDDCDKPLHLPQAESAKRREGIFVVQRASDEWVPRSLLGSAFLGDVGEMLVLFFATVLFVVAILKKEAVRRKDDG